MDLFNEYLRLETRRQFLASGVSVVGAAALSALFDADSARGAAADKTKLDRTKTALPTHHKAKTRQIIYLHMVGGPPQMDLYDYKPKMQAWFDKDLPNSVRMGQRLTTMTSGQARFPIAPSKYKWGRHGKNGVWVSELVPWMAKLVDDIAVITTNAGRFWFIVPRP